MKKRCSSYMTVLASVASLALLSPVSSTPAHASPNPALINPAGPLDPAAPDRMGWEESKRHKLRHAYWLLEQSDRDYKGHKDKALEQIRKAGELIGMDLHGEGYGGEKQKWSDERLREARGLLKEVALETGGGHEHEHLRSAIKELDRALEVR